MTETPREPSGPGEWTPEYTTDYGSAPPPPPAGSQQPGYTPPPAYTPPAPGTEAPAAQPAPDQPAGYQAPPAATSYQEQPPAVPGGYHAGATGFGYDRTALQNFGCGVSAERSGIFGRQKAPRRSGDRNVGGVNCAVYTAAFVQPAQGLRQQERLAECFRRLDLFFCQQLCQGLGCDPG